MSTHHRVIITAAIALAIGASAESAAATPVGVSGSVACGDVCSGHGYVTGNSSTTSTPISCGDVCSGHGYVTGSSSIASIPPAIVRLAVPGNGFDWGDAGIGAAGGLVLSMTGIGGGMAFSRRRAARAASG